MLSLPSCQPKSLSLLSATFSRAFSASHSTLSSSASVIQLPQFSIFAKAAKAAAASTPRALANTTAIVDPDGSNISYGELLRAVRTFADSSSLRDAKPGDRVAFLCPRDSSFVISQWGTWAREAIAVPLCAEHPASELAHVISDSQASRVLFHPLFTTVITATRNDPRVIAQNPIFICVDPVTEYLQATLPQTTTLTTTWTPLDKTQGALIIYTSGTTGRPKGVLTTFANIEAQVASLHTAWRWSAADKILLLLPLHHIHGVINIVTCALAAAATLEFTTAENRTPSRIWARILSPAQDLSLFMAVPTIYARLIAEYNKADFALQLRMRAALKQFRLAVSGSAALPVPLFDAWAKIAPAPLLERYGMTEVGMALGNPYDGLRESGSVGVPFPGVETMVWDDTTGKDVKDVEGASGELYIRGPQIFKELSYSAIIFVFLLVLCKNILTQTNRYWNNPEATQKTFENGWFKTGDIVTVTKPHNTYKILGRASVDIIKSGGFKLSALVIEREILSLETVQDVAVVGVPDEIWGERVGAVVILKNSTALVEDNKEIEQRLKNELKARLAKYEIPTVWVFCDEIPRNAMGKVNKKSLVS
ncbi:hypothetical protein HK100_003620, partial [Physocladia obscura]